MRCYGLTLPLLCNLLLVVTPAAPLVSPRCAAEGGELVMRMGRLTLFLTPWKLHRKQPKG
jgi:hypothetical protein